VQSVIGPRSAIGEKPRTPATLALGRQPTSIKLCPQCVPEGRIFRWTRSERGRGAKGNPGPTWPHVVGMEWAGVREERQSTLRRLHNQAKQATHRADSFLSSWHVLLSPSPAIEGFAASVRAPGPRAALYGRSGYP
jgi:hypothetical protein